VIIKLEDKLTGMDKKLAKSEEAAKKLEAEIKAIKA
jgi:hypothetical protein